MNPPSSMFLDKVDLMNTKLYVGNLSFNTSDQDLSQIFGEYGEVSRATMVTDRDTGRSRGFAFVEMASADGAQAAIRSLDGQTIDGRAIQVNIARPREDRGGGGGGGGYGGGGGGRSGGGGGGRSGGGGGGRGGW
jgi:cold-inducible RNA-binding protein